MLIACTHLECYVVYVFRLLGMTLGRNVRAILFTHTIHLVVLKQPLSLFQCLIARKVASVFNRFEPAK